MWEGSGGVNGVVRRWCGGVKGGVKGGVNVGVKGEV